MKLTSTKLIRMIKEEVKSFLAEEKTSYDAADLVKKSGRRANVNFDHVEANGNVLEIILVGSVEEIDEDLWQLFQTPKNSFEDNISKSIEEFFDDHGFNVDDVYVESMARGGPENLFINVTFSR